MKVLEALIKAYGWQGGTIHQALAELPKNQEPCKAKYLPTFYNIGKDTEERRQLIDVWNWGFREGKELRHGDNIASYSVPANSWNEDCNKQCTINYVIGIIDGINHTKRLAA